jgi:hypothetical protein
MYKVLLERQLHVILTKYVIPDNVRKDQRLSTYEKWIEELEETYACSDGITVDLTPPIPGRVWIGVDPFEHYQV